MVKDFLVDRGFDQKQGARPLRRSIQEHFEDVLADRLLTGNMRGDVSVKASLKKDHVVFSVRRILSKVSKDAIKASSSQTLVPSAT